MSIGVVFGCVSGYFDNYLNNKLQNFMHILSKITAISQEILEKKIWFAGNGKKNATLHVNLTTLLGRRQALLGLSQHCVAGRTPPE